MSKGLINKKSDKKKPLKSKAEKKAAKREKRNEKSSGSLNQKLNQHIGYWSCSKQKLLLNLPGDTLILTAPFLFDDKQKPSPLYDEGYKKFD